MIADTCLYPGAKGIPARLQFGRERWGDVMDAVLDDRRVDPFKIWLDALPPWDGESRLDFWLGHVFEVGEINEDLLSWASRSVLMGVVLRTDSPEKHDEMVVLVGGTRHLGSRPPGRACCQVPNRTGRCGFQTASRSTTTRKRRPKRCRGWSWLKPLR